MSVRLPVAAPAFGGTIMPVIPERCWANRVSIWSDKWEHCRATVDPNGFGLCDRCYLDLLGEP